VIWTPPALATGIEKIFLAHDTFRFRCGGKMQCKIHRLQLRMVEVMDMPERKPANLLRFSYLMTVTHLSECSKGKLKNWHVIPANSGIPECFVIATRLQLRAKRGRSEAGAVIQ
jgi:hypothetical protein